MAAATRTTSLCYETKPRHANTIIVLLDLEFRKISAARFYDHIIDMSVEFRNADACVEYITSLKEGEAFLYLLVRGDIQESTFRLMSELPQIQAIYVLCIFNRTGEYEPEHWAYKYPKVVGIFYDNFDMMKELEHVIFTEQQPSETPELIRSVYGDKIRNLNESYIIVWLNPEHSDHLRGIDKVETFTDANECIDYILLSKKKIFLVLSMPFCEYMVPFIDEISQIVYIYIYDDTNLIIESGSRLEKLRGHFSNPSILTCKLMKDIVASSSMPMMSTFRSKENSTQRLGKENTTFVWFQTLIDILINIPQTSETKKEMLDVCRRCYKTDSFEQQKIEKLNTEYESKSAIGWYTSDSCIYRLLNSALRTQDIGIIYAFRFFITDLHNQLKKLCADNNVESTGTLYRGQVVPFDEFTSLKSSVGQLMCINGFLSTTRDRDVALAFAGHGLQRPENESVLFEITIDHNNGNTKPFADITRFSMFGNESEILFSIGAVFRIDSIIAPGNENVWIIKLTLSNATKELDEISGVIEQFSSKGEPLLTLAYILAFIGEQEKADAFLKLTLPEYSSNGFMTGVIYTLIASKLHDETALPYFELANKKYDFIPDNKDPINRVGILGTTALYLLHMRKYIEAIQCFKNLLVIYNGLVDLEQQHWYIGNLHSHIGNAYRQQNNYRAALHHYFKGLHNHKLAKKPEKNPFIAILLCDIAAIYLKVKLYEKAIEYSKLSIELKLNVYSSNHRQMTNSYTALAQIYCESGNYKDAIVYFKKLIEISDQTEPKDYETLANLYAFTGATYLQDKQYEAALFYCEKGLEINSKMLGPTHSLILTLEAGIRRIRSLIDRNT